MPKTEYAVSVDVGSSAVRVVVATPQGQNLNVLGVGQVPSRGVRKGAIVDIEEASSAIREAVDQAAHMVGVEIGSAYVALSSHQIEMTRGHGVVAVAADDHEIHEGDVRRVVEAAGVVALPPERQIVDIVPQQYIVDGLGGISDPRGMVGVRLEVEASILTGSRTVLHNLERALQGAGLTVNGMVLSALGAGTTVLSADERELGAVLCDLGGGSTAVSVFEHGVLVYTGVVDAGGEYVTNDIALGLRVDSDTAEKIKRRYGCAMERLANEETTFSVPHVGSRGETSFTQRDLAAIIEPRIEELLLLAKDRLLQAGFHEPPASGVVLIGGQTAMPGIAEKAEEIWGVPVRIATPPYVGVRDAVFVNGVGVLQYVLRAFRGHAPTAENTHGRSSNAGWVNRIRGWFSDFVS
ncbi:MAG: cell division protein FtsA [Firmicutes bacterium]|nr:cell division protein FtsA [Bacillota bacterium]